MPSPAWGLSPLSPLDDFPYHQISEPMRHVGTSDRNFYDRYYFNCHPGTDEVFLITGMGQYPNLGVADAFAVVRHDDKHRVVRASRELGSDRSDTSVGPFHVEVLEGLQRLRVTLEPNQWDLSFDLTWEGAVPAVLEPRHLDRQFGRVLFDSTRFAQVGNWTGSIDIGATTFKVTPDAWQGSRDRSWGVRPVGESEPPGIAAHKPNGGFFWLYAPMQFDDHAVVVVAQERADGTRVLEEAVRVWADPDREPELLGRIAHELVYESGTRRVRHATLRMTEPDGSPLVVDIEVLLPLHVGVGTGYGLDADWRHGMYQGKLVVQGLVHDLATDEGRDAMWGIVDSVARFEVTAGSTAGAIGHGLFEHMNLGPYARYGFKDFLDPAR